MIRWLMISLRVTLIISDELGITFLSNQYHGAKEGIERCIWCSLKQSSRPPRVGDGMFIKPVQEENNLSFCGNDVLFEWPSIGAQIFGPWPQLSKAVF